MMYAFTCLCFIFYTDNTQVHFIYAQVNFDEEDEDELAESQEEAVRESVRLSNTPLRPIISAAEGARAISTPAGQMLNIVYISM